MPFDTTHLSITHPRLHYPHQVVIPKLSHDASQLRADVTGRLLRFLVPESGIVEAGQPYAEVETMKMTSELVARARGKVH